MNGSTLIPATSAGEPWTAGVSLRPEPRSSPPGAALIEPLLSVVDLARILNGSRRTVERMRAAGKLPRPDLHVGKMPRWRPETIRAWIDDQAQARRGR